MELTNNGESRRQDGSVDLSIDDAVDAVQFGKFQKIMMIAVGLCFMSDAMEVVLLGFLSAVLRYEWDLTTSQAAAIAGSVFGGELVGSAVLGRLGDVFGRRKIFLAAAAIICVAGAATSIVPGYKSLVLVRFIVGFGVGGLTVPYDIFAEFLPNQMRGRCLMYVNYYWTAGSMMVTLFAFFTLGLGYSWRLFVLLCSIPGLASFILCYRYVPESPRWLLAEGRANEALVILRNVADINGKISNEIFPEGCCLLEEEKESSDICELFKPKWRKLTFLIWGVWISFGFGYYGTIILSTTRVFQSNESTNDDAVTTGPEFNYGALFVTSTAEIAGVLLSILTVDSWGRVPSQVLGYAGGGISVFLMCTLSENGAPVAILTLVAFIARTFEMSASCVTWISTAEIYSTEIRSTGHSVANVMCRLSAFCCPFVVENASLRMVAFIMVLVHLLGVISGAFLPETKDVALGKFAKAEFQKKSKSGNSAGEPFFEAQTTYAIIE
eukprot:CAMPEP_0194328878 /NCGR_PEP_ID=MMETSP0171-20130528/46233_1 /TAXON_ID=218684 /ORGANISM="Corethron pennatum, Strain L29A3" /LENGTH=495 /DNA_ID=CAMNT_0039089387 /DNA_START=93 /DNA_END=1580 /DNA_ORIENTATION=+